MTQITLRLPDSLHRRAKELSAQDHVSLNTMITTALSEKIASMETLETLRQRAAKGKNIPFSEAFSEVPDGPPIEGDELPER